MGRGRVKGKKLSSTSQDDVGSGEDEKIPQQKRRGRPHKPLKDEMEEEEARKIEDEDDSEDTLDKDAKGKASTVGKKRTRNSQVKENVGVEAVKEENGNGSEETNKRNGFRANGHRRKNKPRRAPEAVVECS